VAAKEAVAIRSGYSIAFPGYCLVRQSWCVGFVEKDVVRNVVKCRLATDTLLARTIKAQCNNSSEML